MLLGAVETELARSAVVTALAAKLGFDAKALDMADVEPAALADAKKQASDAAIAAGARADSVAIVDVEDVPLTYLPGNATRIRVKAVGKLSL